jgi:PAS domain S-box-containing protein
LTELKVSNEAKFKVTITSDNHETFNQFKDENSRIDELSNIEEKFGLLKISNERIFDSVGDAILVIDPYTYHILSANEAASKQLKLSKEALVGKTCYEVTHHNLTPCEPPYDICPIKEMLVTGKSTIVEHQHFDNENRRIDVEVSVHPVKDNNKKIIQAVHIDRNITSRKELEREAKTKSDEIRGIIDGIGDLLFVMDKNRVITEVNKSTCEAFKKKPEELVGKHCYEIVHGTNCPWPNCPATNTFKINQTVTEEVNDSNVGFPLLVTTSPLLDEKGEVDQIIHIAKDISKLKLAEMELHIAANLFDAASDSILVHDIDGRLVYFNEATYKARGYTRDEFQTLALKDLETPGDPRFFEARLNKLLNKGEATFEAVNLRKDKTILQVEINARVIESDGRKLVLSVSRDITERKKAEKALQESEKEYSSLFSNMMAGLAYCQMIFDEENKPIDFIYLQINNAFERITGLNRSSIIGKKATIAIPGIKDANPELFDIYGRVSLTGQTEDFELFFKPLNMWLQISVYCPRKGYFAAIFVDTSKRKEAEEKLKASEKKYETTFEASMDALMLLDEKGFFDCNKSTLALFGVKSVEDFSRYHPADFSPPTQPDGALSLEAAMNHLKKAFKTGSDNFFWVHMRLDGTTFPADVLLTRMPLNGRVVLLATVRDITQQKEYEENLKQAEEKHRTLLNAANVLVQSVDAEGKYIFVNEEWKNVLGYTLRDLECISMMNVVRQDQLQHCLRVFKQVMGGKSIHDVETVFVAKDGREIVVSGNACPIFKDGKFVSTVAFFVDITARKKNEEKIKESNRRIELMVEKLRVVGSLSRHDVRNKLSTVTGYAYLLKKKHSDQVDVVEGLSKMEQAVKESIRIFEFARMYEQLGAEELTYINVESKLNEACTLFSGSLPKIITECHGVSVLADSFLRQLFYNFIDNTRKYGQKTTTILVYCEKTDDNKLKIVYEDNGIGIPLESKEFLFKEGYSTGGSTGFGLFLTKKMMDVYGWKIEENGEPGKGVKFTITIPKINPNGKENFQVEKGVSI